MVIDLLVLERLEISSTNVNAGGHVTIYRRISSAALALVFVFSLLFVGGCTKYASQKDVDNLQEAKSAAVSSEKELDQVKTTRKNLERELQAKKDELQVAEDDLKTLKGQ